LAIIDFWNTTSGLMCGSWLQPPQQLQHHTPVSANQDTAVDAALGHSRPLQGNPSTGPPAHPSTAAAPTAAAAITSHEVSSSSPEIQYLSWVWTLGPAGRLCSCSQDCAMHREPLACDGHVPASGCICQSATANFAMAAMC
jgi:hypothetical protein